MSKNDVRTQVNVRLSKWIINEVLQNPSNKSERVRELILKGKKYEDLNKENRSEEFARFIRVPSWLSGSEVETIQRGIDEYLKRKIHATEDFELDKVVQHWTKKGTTREGYEYGQRKMSSGSQDTSSWVNNNTYMQVSSDHLLCAV